MLLMQPNEQKAGQKITAPDFYRWGSSFQRELFSSLRREIIWRLPLLYLLFGVLIGFIMSYHHEVGRQQSVFILLGVAVILILQFLITRVSDSARLFDVLYLICGVTAIVPLGFLIAWQYDYYFLLLTFFTQALCWMLFPWPLAKGFCWAVFLLSYWAIILNLKEPGILHLLPLLPIMFIAVCIPRLRYQDLCLHQAHIFMSKLSTATRNNLELCLQMCKLILFSADSKKAAALMADGRVFKLENDRCLLFDGYALPVGAIYTLLKDRAEESGVWVVKKNELAHRAFMLDCIGSKARKFRYYFLRTYDKGKETEALLIVPSLHTLDSISFARAWRGVKSLADIYNISLFTLRSQNMSNDTVLAYGTALEDRDKDINQIVHTVNNNSQEIAIHCDSIKQLINQKNTAPDMERVILKEAEGIEDNIRLLTQNVSDIKLVREISALRSLPRKEKVPLKAMLADFWQFAEKSATTKGCKLIFENKINSDTDGAVAPSSDYFETTMRVMLRQSVNRAAKSGVIYFAAAKNGENVIFDFADNGEGGGDGLELSAVKSYFNYAGGALEEVRGELPYQKHYRATLPYAEIKEIPKVAGGNWALLVDDNEQLITFYSRIAEALGMQYKTARSVPEAIKALEEMGSKPRIAITDIQLSNSSGLELVKHLREKYGKALPIIVVSGNDDVGVSGSAHTAGVTKYLRKPLGRKRLFSEIEGLLV